MMAILRTLVARLKALVATGRSDAALEDDIQAHLELLADEYIGRGLSAEEARTAARRAFGGVQQLRESYREQRGLPIVEHLLRDLRDVGRSLRRTRGLTVVAVMTIALGIFGPTVTFTIAKAWILEPLPFARPDDLIDLRNLDTRSGTVGAVNVADFLDWRRSTTSFEQIAAYRGSDFRVSGENHTEHLRGATVTSNFFATLGVNARAGRLFDPTGTDAVQATQIVISSALWHERFRDDPGAIGRTIRIDGDEQTIVGVLPDTFQFTLLGRCDVWRALVWTPEQATNRRGRAIVGLGRLRQGFTVETARRDLTRVAAQLSAIYPATNERRGVRVLRLAEEVRRHHDFGMVPVLFAIAGFVLLMACVNVTNVMLARASTRRQELAVRLALGASRGNIIRPWMVEHVALFLLGSALGAALAVYGADWITQSIPVDNRQYLRNYAVLHVDRLVVLFALSVGALCGLLFGGLTASTAVRADVTADLRETTTRTTADRTGTRLRASLIICQVALALAVLVSAGLLVVTARNLTRASVGFDADRLLTFRLDLDTRRYRGPADFRGFYERLTTDLGRRPAVVSAAAGSLVPFGTNGNGAELLLEGSPERPPAQTPTVSVSQITADYPRTLLSLVRGRVLSGADNAESLPAALINETAASHYFADQDPIGRRFRLGRETTTLWSIVGIVGDIKNDMTIGASEPEVYVPFAQQPRRAMTVVVRTSGDPEQLVATAREAVVAIDPEEPIIDVATMAERIHRETGPYQTISSFVAFFGVVTLLLAGVGVYGVISYSWSRRTREIGIRIALGARRLDVGTLVLKQIRTFLLAGLLPGLLLAWTIGSALQAMLVGVTPTDWRVYLSMTMLLATVAFIAVLVPTRRAMSVDPMKALHDE